MVCGAWTGHEGVGRPRLYCSQACRQRAYRARNWQGTPRQSSVRRRRAAKLACALVGKAACVQVMLAEPERVPRSVLAGYSASDLTHAALDHARELLQILEL